MGARGFDPILEMIADGVGSRSLLHWLMDKLDYRDMTLRPGPGKELRITKETVRLILGLPSAGGGKPFLDYWGQTEAHDSLRAQLGLGRKVPIPISLLMDRLSEGNDDPLSIRCFFLILYNRFLFPTSSWNISNTEVLLTEEIDNYPNVDVYQLVFNDICKAAEAWHTRDRTNQTTTISGCVLVIMVTR